MKLYVVASKQQDLVVDRETDFCNEERRTPTPPLYIGRRQSVVEYHDHGL